MNAKVIDGKCIGCGNCVSLTEGQVFDFNEYGLAECVVNPVPRDLVDITKEAIEQCPTNAIEEK